MVSFELKYKLSHYSVTTFYTFKYAAIDGASHYSVPPYIISRIMFLHQVTAKPGKVSYVHMMIMW